MQTSHALTAAALLAVAGLGTGANADLVEASTWNGGGQQDTYPNAVGWQFTALSDMTVTHLGVLDLGAAGLADRHTVGIFNLAGDLMVSATIGAGLSGDLYSDSMIYNAVELTTLHQGESYYILADNWTQDQYGWGWDAVSFSDDVEWTNFSETTGPSIFDTVLHYYDGEPGTLGPGFMYEVVPSPGAFALLGLAGCVARRRRRA
tara:strand:+ start:5108 stop:5722 length:615 start_codon:yes stop_codon:yes gene_type:complete